MGAPVTVAATSHILALSRSKGTARLVLLCLSDNVGGDDSLAAVRISTLTSFANCSIEELFRAIHRLQGLGEIRTRGGYGSETDRDVLMLIDLPILDRRLPLGWNE